MMQQKNKFLSLFFQFLSKENYVLLKHIHDTIAEIEDNSDIDILLFDRKKTLRLILAFVKNASLIQKYDVQSQSSMTQIFIYFNDNSFLQIDCLYQLIRKNTVYLSNDYIFENKRFLSDNTTTYSHQCLLEHLVLFNFLNHAGIPQKYIDFFNNLELSEQENLLMFFNKKYETNIVSFEHLNNYNKNFYLKIIDFIIKINENNLLNKFKNSFLYLKDSVNNIIYHRGKIISFSGVDGAGKSTLLAATKEIISEKYRRKVVVLRHRPSILPILSSIKYGKKNAEQKAAKTLPRQGTNKSKIGSFLRFAYYYVDYVFGQNYIWLKYVLRNYVVIYDRYYFDFIVDGKRSNINLHSNFTKYLYKLVCKPNANFLLYAPAVVILKRKQELDEAAITELTTNYLQLFQELQKTSKVSYVSIENIDIEKSIDTIVQCYIKIV